MRATGNVIWRTLPTRAKRRPSAAVESTLDSPSHPSRWVSEQVASVSVTIAVLATLGFLYASLIPLIFRVPDFRARFLAMFEPSPWNAAQVLDVGANVLAFVPLGFLWAAACHTVSGPRQTQMKIFAAVGCGCLGLATLAETLQFWIPLRDPSLRDVFALEMGALVGYGLWRVMRRRTTVALSWLVEQTVRLGGWRLYRLRWPLLLATVFLVCFVVNCYASPSQLFLLYRFRSTSLHDVARALHNADVARPRGPLAALLPSTLATILIGGACRASQSAVRFGFRRSMTRL